jgi:hypothetical protein
MAGVFWDSEGILVLEYLKKGILVVEYLNEGILVVEYPKRV